MKSLAKNALTVVAVVVLIGGYATYQAWSVRPSVSGTVTVDGATLAAARCTGLANGVQVTVGDPAMHDVLAARNDDGSLLLRIDGVAPDSCARAALRTVDGNIVEVSNGVQHRPDPNDPKPVIEGTLTFDCTQRGRRVHGDVAFERCRQD